MKITCFTVVWNEEFLLPYFLRHYDFCDKIVVYDNQSDDGTKEILQANSKVEHLLYDTNGQQDNRTMAKIKNNCWKGTEADYVIVVDVDEFVIPDWDLLKKHLSEKVAFQLLGFDMIGARDGKKPLEDINRALQLPFFSKLSVFNPSIDEINYVCGAHHAEPTCPITLGMELHHYSLLGREYLVKRWQRYASRMSDTDIRRNYGGHYRISESGMLKTFHIREHKSKRIASLNEIYASEAWKKGIINNE